MDTLEVRRCLLSWYDAHRRDLPWRRTPFSSDPYAVLVSEVMCQQTRVDVVVPYFQAWMQAWPTVQDLARADEEEVLAAWSGLGYYRRARNLHRAARQVDQEGWPNDLQDLPGVGPYIAGAVASIAFDRPAVAVDGNVQRVLSRLGDIQDDVTRAEGRRAVEALAGRLLADDRAGDWTQALMELGARVCTPLAPDCKACPVVDHCTAEAPEALPVKTAKALPVEEEMHFAAVLDRGRVLLVRRPEDALLGGTWALPGGAVHEPLQGLVEMQTGCTVRVLEAHGVARHLFSHRRWNMRVHAAEVVDEGPLPGAVQWVPMQGLQQVGMSSAMRKALEAAPAAVPQAH